MRASVRHHTRSLVAAVSLMLLLLPGLAGAQDSGGSKSASPPVEPPPPPERLLPEAPSTAPAWSKFSSPEAGIELMVPPGFEQQSDDGNVLVQVANQELRWQFEVRRLPLEMPMDLEAQEMPEGGRRDGLLELMSASEQQNWQGELLREPSMTPLGDADAGVYVLRFSGAGGPQMRQVALIRAGETLYYQIALTSAAPVGTKQQLAKDDRVREAVEAFNRSLNSFRVLDQTQLRQEQEERLIRTRTLFVNLTKARLMSVLEPEQWWRIRRDGRDIGYSYLIEEPARQIPADPLAREAVDVHGARGMRIGIRTHLRRDGGWLDRETWMFATDDLREEDFRERNQLIVDGQRKSENLVVGMMRGRQMPRSLDVPGPLGKQKGFTVVDSRRLEVTYIVNGTQTNNPLNRQLPAWYLPQAINHLLPRLVAPWGRNTYLVAVYNPERREVYQQYVDVEGLSNEKVQDEQRLVMVVTTRMGLSGPRTRHLIDPETFKWLGSINEEDRIEIWPTSEQALRQLWENPELTVPDARGRE